MVQVGPVQDIGSFNAAIEDIVEEAQHAGMDDAQIVALLEQQVTAMAAQLMRERQGMEFQAAKAIRSNAQASKGLAGRL